MSDPESGSRSEHSSGFQRFWKKSTSPPETQFIDESPAASSSSKKDRSGFSRLFSRANGSSSKVDDKGERRRQQIYSAQKRHRNRKDEYIKNLEAEIEKLRSLDSAINTERITLEHENQKMRNRLAGLSNGVSNGDLTFASVFVQHDPVTNQDRVYVEDVKAHENDLNDSWIALDFILALEWPCRGHHDHPVTKSATSNGPTCPDAEVFHGHGMTMTGAVLSSIQNPDAREAGFQSVNREGLDPEILKKWKLPHSEIDKLVKLAEMLPLDDNVFTPAQAYAATKAAVKDTAQLKATLEKLKYSLADISDCEGFGAVMSSKKFGERLREALSS